MNTAAAGNSLSHLRAKTDRELGILARRELERALALAGRAHYHDARRAYLTARNLLAISETTGDERALLENKLEELRGALDRPTLTAALCA